MIVLCYLDNAIIITKKLRKETIVTKTIMFFCVLLLMGCVEQPSIEEKKVKRIALVIGNQNYQDNVLKNPINDATSIAEVLKKIGFKVTLKLDTTLAELNKSLRALKNEVEPNNTMVFIYFAGHGNTVDENASEEYLLMTDQARKTLVSIYKFYDFLRDVESRYNIICIDACRDYRQYNAVEAVKNGENFRGNLQTRGLRTGKGSKEIGEAFFDNNYSYKMPRSTIVSYAAMHQQRANDVSKNDKNHSSYAYGLIKFLDDKEIPIEEVFRRVRISQLEESNGTQSNLEETNLEKNIWLLPRKANITFMPPL
ncbi:MAG: Unknown protein [uncultured Sulfurovum sp.]|uniref:Caspase family p20 domain-containing protein n=1 Tax=uncultured Sulfurovum sp. TaxID=269237 RepID=A0A6S6TEH7_9BACT|nr:MAG: Unknown protein [uncultured Sulfurovum sp.]